MDMRAFLARNKRLLAITALLMAGSGCIGAVRETNRQLMEDALKPVSDTQTAERLRLEQGGLEE